VGDRRALSCSFKVFELALSEGFCACRFLPLQGLLFESAPLSLFFPLPLDLRPQFGVVLAPLLFSALPSCSLFGFDFPTLLFGQIPRLRLLGASLGLFLLKLAFSGFPLRLPLFGSSGVAGFRFLSARSYVVLTHLFGAHAAHVESRVFQVADRVDIADLFLATHLTNVCSLFEIGDGLMRPSLVGHTRSIPTSHGGFSYPGPFGVQPTASRGVT